MIPDLEHEFDTAMKQIYIRAKAEAGLTLTRFLQLLTSSGSVEAARRLLHSDKVSDGYTSLWEKGRLDLTVEALVLDPMWQSLFTEEELETARERLSTYGYEP